MGTREMLTDERGRYSLSTGDPATLLVASKTGMTEVEREVAVASGTGTVPVDARLTVLGKAGAVGVDGATLTGPGVTVDVPAGAPGSSSAVHLTPLTAHGLPAPLTLGHAPVFALELRPDAR